MPQSAIRIGASAARTERAASPFGFVGAVLLHVAIVVATFFTWSHRLDVSDLAPPVVPVDLVTIGEKTNIAAMVKERPKEEAPVQDQTAPAPEPKVEPKPEASAQEESAPPPVTSAPAPVEKKPPMVTPTLRPQVEPKKDTFDLSKIAALLDKRNAAATSAPQAKLGNRNLKGIGAQTALTMDLQDALRNQIAQCWSPPVGAPNPQDLVVDLDLFLNPDGSVARPPQLIASSGGASSAYTRAAVEAASRAIYQCAPYKLPPDKYALWHEINPFHFDPRQMMGQ